MSRHQIPGRASGFVHFALGEVTPEDMNVLFRRGLRPDSFLGLFQLPFEPLDALTGLLSLPLGLSLAPLRKAVKGHGVNTTDGRTYNKAVTDGIIDVTHRLNNLAARKLIA